MMVMNFSLTQVQSINRNQFTHFQTDLELHMTCTYYNEIFMKRELTIENVKN